MSSWQAAAIATLDAGGVRIAYRVLGVDAGPPVVLVHSGGLSARQWRRLAESLADRYRVIVPDLIGYGGSTPWPDGKPFAFTLDVAAIVALLDTLDPDRAPVALVGHSYGGLVAAHAALARPTTTRALALFEPVTFGIFGADARDGLDRLSLTYEVVDDLWLAQFVEWWNGPGAWAALAEDTRASFRQVGWKLFQEVASLVADTTPAAAYAIIDAPALLLGGERSPAVEREVLVRLAAALPHATHVQLAGMGHMGPITHAAVVNAAIIAHLDAHAPAR